MPKTLYRTLHQTVYGARMVDEMDIAEGTSALRAIMVGAGAALAAGAVFITAYLIAPNVSLPWTFALAAVMGALLLVLFAYLPWGRSAGSALPAYAAEPATDAPLDDPASSDRVIDLADATPSLDRRPGAEARRQPRERTSVPPANEAVEARLAALREDAAAKRRSKSAEERSLAFFAWGEALYEVGMHEVTSPARKEQRLGLARLRQAVNAFRRALDDRNRETEPRDWAATQMALCASLYTLGVGEGERQHVEQSAEGYAAVLELTDLADEERVAAEAGLAQSEGALANMAATNQPTSEVDLF